MRSWRWTACASKRVCTASQVEKKASQGLGEGGRAWSCAPVSLGECRSGGNQGESEDGGGEAEESVHGGISFRGGQPGRHPLAPGGILWTCRFYQSYSALQGPWQSGRTVDLSWRRVRAAPPGHPAPGRIRAPNSACWPPPWARLSKGAVEGGGGPRHPHHRWDVDTGEALDHCSEGVLRD
jgi:hypothetical protein